MKRRLIQTFFFVAIVLIHKLAFAQMFVGYDQFCGVPVIVTPTSLGAVAGRDQFGNPIIYVDPGVMANWTTSRMFALAHECGHHMLGHSTPQGMMARNWATKQQELEADCWASTQLARILDIQDLERQIKQFARQGPRSQGPYPSGWERAYAAAECAGISLQTNQRGNRLRQTKWQYEYSRLDSDRWKKSTKFSSEEECERSQSRKDESPNYVVMECEEVE